MVSVLRKLFFLTPNELGKNNLLVRRDKKPKKSQFDKTEAKYYYGKVEQIFGQLELGYKNNHPHYPF